MRQSLQKILDIVSSTTIPPPPQREVLTNCASLIHQTSGIVVLVSRSKFRSCNARYRFTVTPDPVGVSEGLREERTVLRNSSCCLFCKTQKLITREFFMTRMRNMPRNYGKTMPFCLFRYFAKQKLIVSSETYPEPIIICPMKRNLCNNKPALNLR